MGAIVVPPYRTPLGNGSGTTKDWWLFWKTLGDLGNAGMKMLTFGPHAARPDGGNMPDGAIYVETDRGDVVYQLQAGVWHYLSGLMFGTLVPDQRPTDLGVNDAGFDFRTSVNPPREFMWSQTAWVEITAVVDPTTTRGDVLVRGASVIQRLGVGAPGTVLTANATAALGVDWEIPPGGSGSTSGVSSVFGRTGGVTAVSTDYSAYYVPVGRQVLAGTGLTGGGALSADVTLTAKPMVASGASHSAGTVPDPGAAAGTTRFLREDATWAAPAGGASQTPWTSNINGGGFNLSNVAGIVIGASTPQPGLNVTVSALGTTCAAFNVAGGTQTSFIGFGATGDWYIRSAVTTGKVLIQDAGGSVGIGTATPGSTLHVSAPDSQFLIQGTGATKAAGFVVNTGAGDPTQGGLTIQRKSSTGTFEAVLVAVNLANGNLGLGGILAPAYQLQLNTDSAGKPATSAWTISSGGAVKQNIRPLAGGLDIIRQLVPTEAEYNGKAGTPRGQRVVSLIAEEVRKVLPHTVSEDAEGNLGFNVHEVIFHLILAVQQLSAGLKEKP